MLPALLSVLENVEDPRINRTRRQSLPAILAIALCAVLCGADSWGQIQAYGNAKQTWFSQWLALPYGIPSHDTFIRVFSLLQPAVLRACLQATAQALCDGKEKQIALDGKYLRRSFDTAAKQGPLIMLSAWARSQELVAASVPADLKSNEIKALPELLASLDITGYVVTPDAMGCQRAVAAQIGAQGGEYVLDLSCSQI